MVDKVSKETRSKIMGSIRAVSKLEDLISSALWARGLRFWRNSRRLMGTPDWSISKYKVVIFLDSCFWHSCEIHGNIPKSNTEFWENKFSKNKERDKKVTEYYLERGWNILRIWEHEVRQDFDAAIDKMEKFIMDAKRNSNKSVV
ncbi:very short patch repair endonuclease [Priestia abyssalis]|uniref:very short patch repair endonuclease n=1 Tax=Priestia abyssalis TaxID=1221450 RepID=UPI000995CC94|nr:very short patch repair endonuclease [Priestia abyssalis]